MNSTLLLALLAASATVVATPQGEKEEIEELLVLGEAVSTRSVSIEVNREVALDTAQILRRLPGADANTNGPLTGIAHYRGMFGDRVAVSIDGLGVIGGGPNAMDPPLSYVSPMITESLILERGVPGVASAPEAIGGHVEAKLARGDFGVRESFELSGIAGARYSQNANARSTALRMTAANDSHRLSAVAQSDRGSDFDTPAGKVLPSRLARDRYDLSYGFSDSLTNLLVFAGGLDTRDTGTPALAMDIRFIDSDLYGVRVSRALSPTFTTRLKLGYNAVDHLMDNFGLRPAPDSPMQYRQNLTTGSGTTFALSGDWANAGTTLRAGVDGRFAKHTSLITNPENQDFYISNFNNIERDVVSFYSLIERQSRDSDWELGARYIHVASDADDVSLGGMMGPMGSAASALADAFNSARHERSFNTVDYVFKFSRPVAEGIELGIDVGSRTRAPSYQELYLWLPLQATGGLADGRNYIGNLDLDPERSNEIAVGLDWSGSRLTISPQAYYRRVTDYIQGVPADTGPANMLATMMSGQPALKFENVDAKIYGLDVGWRLELDGNWSIAGAGSYLRGERTDVDDNLYRQPPLNANVALHYTRPRLTARTEIAAFAGQSRVSRYNDEQPTSGYAVVNALLAWQANPVLRLELQIDNLLDRGYQNHLAGINRVRGAELQPGERLWGIERTVTIGALMSF